MFFSVLQAYMDSHVKRMMHDKYKFPSLNLKLNSELNLFCELANCKLGETKKQKPLKPFKYFTRVLLLFLYDETELSQY